MSYTISKEFAFSASHILEGLPEGHQCGRMHGHNYIVVVVLESEILNQVGFIVDYGDLASFKKMIDEEIDHRHLNDVLFHWEAADPAFMGGKCIQKIRMQPSAENMARWFWMWCQRLHPEWPVSEIRVSETPKTWASYKGTR